MTDEPYTTMTLGTLRYTSLLRMPRVIVANSEGPNPIQNLKSKIVSRFVLLPKINYNGPMISYNPVCPEDKATP